ncbi:SPOR domain-containing protein [Hydrocarboniphaga sp.]|uniref:SPOR domain-containing protein n=1 Tax=Hydrocarboniphaga sp. TaxID=2033016 RepID=UPI003D0B94E9
MARDYAARNSKPSSGSRRPSSGKKKSGGGLPGWVLMLAGLSIGLLVAVFVYVSRPTAEPLRGTSAASDRPSKNRPSADRNAAAEVDDEDEQQQAAKPSTKSTTPPRGRATAKTDEDAAKVTVPPKEKSRFTFYELLPSQEVLVPSQAQAKLTPQQQQALAAQQPQTATPTTPVNGIVTTPGTPPSAIPPSTPPSTAPSAATTGTFIIQVASYRSQSEAEKQKAALALAGVESRIEKVTIDNKDTYYRVRVGPLRDEAKARDTLAQLESNGINAMLVKVK